MQRGSGPWFAIASVLASWLALAACSGNEDGQTLGVGFDSQSPLAPSSQQPTADPGASASAAGTSSAAANMDPSSAAEPDATAEGDPSMMPVDSEGAATELTGADYYLGYCSPCHGEQGAGTELGPEIQHPKRDFAAWVVQNGFEGAYDPPMAAIPEERLTRERLDAILTYLNELPLPTTSEGLYLDLCGNCHGDDGRGGPARKHIAGKNEFDELVRKGKGGTNFAARAEYMPKWSSDELPTVLVEELQAYVGALPE